MQRSPIEWTNFTANPIRYRDPDGNVVHACIHKSGGCLHCYAEILAGRWGRAGKKFTAENMKRLTPFIDDKELHQMLTHKPASGKMCFVGDMTDIFGEWVPDDLLNKLFTDTLEMRTDVVWQLLTKRADRAQKYLSWRWGGGRIPMRNIWLGISVEDQKTADERIPLLLQTPAAVRFVSYEPALGPINWGAIPAPGCYLDGFPDSLHWVIVGGESGPGARPFNIQWARDVVKQCKAAGVACFVKQLGTRIIPPGSWDDFIQKNPIVGKWKVRIAEEPATLKTEDSKGGDWNEWPEDLRVREFPS